MPPPPDPHGIAVMLLAVTALFLFSRDRIPMGDEGRCASAQSSAARACS
jgi:hypothetical protein